MLSITSTADWQTSHPGALIGLLELCGAENTHRAQVLGEAAVGRITWYAAAPVTEVWFHWIALGAAGS